MALGDVEEKGRILDHMIRGFEFRKRIAVFAELVVRLALRQRLSRTRERQQYHRGEGLKTFHARIVCPKGRVRLSAPRSRLGFSARRTLYPENLGDRLLDTTTPAASTAGAGRATVGSTRRTASTRTPRDSAPRIPGAAAPASHLPGAVPNRSARSLESAASPQPPSRAYAPGPPERRRRAPPPLASPARPSSPDPPPTTPRPDSHQRCSICPGTPAPAPICTAGSLVFFA